MYIYIYVCVFHTHTEVVDTKSVKAGDPAGTWESPLAPVTNQTPFERVMIVSEVLQQAGRSNHTKMAFHAKWQIRKKGIAFRWWLLFPYLPHNLLNVLMCSEMTIILNMPGCCYQWNPEQQWWKERMWSVPSLKRQG